MALPTHPILPHDPQGLNRLNENFGFLDTALDSALSESAALRLIANRIYPGMDLTEKHHAEIAAFPNVWEWIRARIRVGNFEDINVGDFIGFTAGENTIVSEVAGINTYREYGDTAVPNHIDFISRDCWPELRVWNRVNYNNGIAAMTQPFLASDIFAWLNGLQASVPNDTSVTMTNNPTLAGSLASVDYRTTGLLPQLPAQLRAVIVQKRVLMPRRHSAGVLLIDDNSWDWRDSGFLWLPSEMEMWGTNVWGSTFSPNQGWSVGGYRKYPIFDLAGKFRKGAGNGGAHSLWWTSTPRGGTSTTVVIVGRGGYTSDTAAAHTSRRAPVCFRIA